jgi:hypothetical protein
MASRQNPKFFLLAIPNAEELPFLRQAWGASGPQMVSWSRGRGRMLKEYSGIGPVAEKDMKQALLSDYELGWACWALVEDGYDVTVGGPVFPRVPKNMKEE